jgi:hypothetical protein
MQNNLASFALIVFAGIAPAAPLLALPWLSPVPSANVTIVPKVHVTYDRCPAFLTWPNNNPAFVPECFEV